MEGSRRPGPKAGYKHREETKQRMRKSAAEVWAERRKLIEMGRAMEMALNAKEKGK